MTIRAYLWGMRVSTLAAFIAFVLIAIYINPIRDGALGQVLFYVSLFFSVSGITTLLLFWLRRYFSRKEVVQKNVGMSFRQGALVAISVCALLFLQSFRLLVWWDGGLVVAAILLIELWFLSR